MKLSIHKNDQESLFYKFIADGYNFFTGVPDSTLKEFISLINNSNIEHVRATWEAEAIGIASGAYLAGKKPCVYMQNAGLGFALNPLTSLCIPYNIKMMLVIGHRHTLPQHKIMGDTDSIILDTIGWTDYVLVMNELG